METGWAATHKDGVFPQEFKSRAALEIFRAAKGYNAEFYRFHVRVNGQWVEI